MIFVAQMTASGELIGNPFSAIPGRCLLPA